MTEPPQNKRGVGSWMPRFQGSASTVDARRPGIHPKHCRHPNLPIGLLTMLGRGCRPTSISKIVIEVVLTDSYRSVRTYPTYVLKSGRPTAGVLNLRGFGSGKRSTKAIQNPIGPGASCYSNTYGIPRIKTFRRLQPGASCPGVAGDPLLCGMILEFDVFGGKAGSQNLSKAYRSKKVDDPQRGNLQWYPENLPEVRETIEFHPHRKSPGVHPSGPLTKGSFH